MKRHNKSTYYSPASSADSYILPFPNVAYARAEKYKAVLLSSLLTTGDVGVCVDTHKKIFSFCVSLFYFIFINWYIRRRERLHE